jgi:hypothetical protein
VISGYAIGGILKSVSVWDEKYNLGMQAGTGLTAWSLSIPVTQFSNGDHVICAKAQATDGQWSPTICRTISTFPATHTEATGYISDTIPAGLGLIFRPAEMLGRSIVVLVSGGTAPDDQNGDNIPDQFQESPITPNYNPSNVPVLMSLVFVAIIVLLIIAIFGIKEYLSKREERIKTIQATPEFWTMQKLKLTMRRGAVQQKMRLKQEWAKLKFQRFKINEKERWLNQEIRKRETALQQSELGRKAVEQKNKELEALLTEKKLFNAQKTKFHVEQKQGSEIPISRTEFERAAAMLGIRAKGKELDITKDQYAQIKDILEKKRSFEEMRKDGMY